MRFERVGLLRGVQRWRRCHPDVICALLATCELCRRDARLAQARAQSTAGHLFIGRGMLFGIGNPGATDLHAMRLEYDDS